MYKNKTSVRRGDDDYNLTYYEDSIEKVVERVDDVDKQLKDVNRRVSSNLTSHCTEMCPFYHYVLGVDYSRPHLRGPGEHIL